MAVVKPGSVHVIKHERANEPGLADPLRKVCLEIGGLYVSCMCYIKISSLCAHAIILYPIIKLVAQKITASDHAGHELILPRPALRCRLTFVFLAICQLYAGVCNLFSLRSTTYQPCTSLTQGHLQADMGAVQLGRRNP